MSPKNPPTSPVSPNLKYLLVIQPQLLPPGTRFSFDNQTSINNFKCTNDNNDCNNSDNVLSTSNDTMSSVNMEVDMTQTGSYSKSKVAVANNNNPINSQLPSMIDTSTRSISLRNDPNLKLYGNNYNGSPVIIVESIKNDKDLGKLHPIKDWQFISKNF